jgi:hypothetical protein
MKIRRSLVDAISKTPLPLLRLAIYLVIIAGCGGVAAYEIYYALAGEVTTATILTFGKPQGAPRNARFMADYEYFDDSQARHVGRTAWAPPTTKPGDQIEVQYLRHTPDTSRLAPSPAGFLCYGAITGLAAVVFVGEFVVRRRRRHRPKWVDSADIPAEQDDDPRAR